MMMMRLGLGDRLLLVVGVTSLLSMNNDGSASPVNDNANVGVMVHVIILFDGTS